VTIREYLAIAEGNLLYVAQLAALVLCAALWLHRKRPHTLLKLAAPKSLGFNLLVALLDALFVAAPLAILLLTISKLLSPYSLSSISVNETWPSLSATLIGFSVLFIGDFVSYWRHRFEHLGWLWRSHAMHHSDESMHWSTIFRFHPINRLTTAVIDSCTLTLIGFPEWAILLNGIARHYYGAFVHIDQPWTLGSLSKFLVSPAMHRWHHVYEGAGVGKNFATIFSVFDRMFGTHYCPGPCTQRLGAPGIEPGLIRQYLLPFSMPKYERDAPLPPRQNPSGEPAPRAVPFLGLSHPADGE